MPELETAVDPRIALEVERQCRCRDVRYPKSAMYLRIERKLLRIGREDQHPLRIDETHAVTDQFRMITLRVEHAFHARGIRECRGIEEYEVEGRALGLIRQPAHGIGLQQPMRGRGKSIELEVG